MGHVSVLIPEGHTVTVHPPGGPAPMQAGMVPDPMAQGAKAAMDAAMPTPEQHGSKDSRGAKAKTKSPAPKVQPKRKS